jgi:predicted TIM-barrel fold metal-dependent hydrolase
LNAGFVPATLMLDMKPSRRQFLETVAGAAIAPALVGLAADARGEERAASPIIDTHQHLWDLSKLKVPWLADAPDVYRRSYRPQEYAEATRGLDIRSVYMEVDVPAETRPAEAEYVIDLCKAKSGATRAAVIGGNPAADGFEDYVRRANASGFVRGVRQVLHADYTPTGMCLADGFVRGVRFLGKINLCFDLCMRPKELRDGVRLSELAPDTRFVLDHCGNGDPKAFSATAGGKPPSHEPDPWKRDIETLAKRPNVICKISGIVANAPEKWAPEQLAPIVNHCLDTFGPDRVVFGGDWPICLVRASLGQWIDALTQITAARPDADRRKLWCENARKFYAMD